MKASVIIIGDELLSGIISDRNGPYLARWLFSQGIQLENLKVIGDDKKKLHQVLSEAWACSDLVITTGGLGPTQDDKTKHALGDFFGGNLLENQAAKTILVRQYQRFDREWSPEHNAYHLIPEGFFPIENPCGFAPGLGLQQEGKLLLAAPGVPRELKAMVEEVWPELLQKTFPQHGQQLQRLTIKTHGVTEEHLFGELAPNLWEQLSPFGKLSSLPQIMGVNLVLTFQGNAQEKLDRLEQVKELLQKGPLKDHIWQWGELPLPHFLLQKFREKKLTLGLAESCTGGFTSHRLTDIPGASEVLMGSAVTYSNQAKTSLLNVSPQTLQEFGAVSRETAQEMAQGALNSFQADWGLSFSGIAGPSGGTATKPVGTVAIGLAGKGISQAQIHHFKGNRQRLKERFSEQGLFSLLKLI